MPPEDKKRLNYISVNADTLTWLVKLANELGEHVGDFAGYLLDECALKWKPPTEGDDPDRQLFWELLDFQRRETLHNRVITAASIYQNKRVKTEEDADSLAAMCDLAGLDYGEIMKQVEGDPFSSVIAYSRNGSVMGNCMRWLVEKMRDRQRMPANLVEVLANRQGFSKSTLDRARRAINMDAKSPAIETKREGRGWVWFVKGLPEKEKEPISEQE
jgi:hypothetical protein